METRKPSQARESNIPLSKLKNPRKIHHCFIQTHSLTLVNGDCPCKAKRKLCNSDAFLSIFLNCPVHRFNFNSFTISYLYDWIAGYLIKVIYYTKSTIHKTFLRIVFCKNNSRADFQMQCFRRKTSLLKS